MNTNPARSSPEPVHPLPASRAATAAVEPPCGSRRLSLWAESFPRLPLTGRAGSSTAGARLRCHGRLGPDDLHGRRHSLRPKHPCPSPFRSDASSGVLRIGSAGTVAPPLLRFRRAFLVAHGYSPSSFRHPLKSPATTSPRGSQSSEATSRPSTSSTRSAVRPRSSVSSSYRSKHMEAAPFVPRTTRSDVECAPTIHGDRIKI